MKSSKPVSVIAALSVVSAFVLVAFGAMALEAVAAMVAWGWFVPSILGLPKLNFQESIGLVLLVNFVLLPLVIPLNSMNATMTKYAKSKATSDLVMALRGFVDIDKKNKEMD